MKVFLRPSAALFMVVLAYGAENPDPTREADNQVLVISPSAMREAAVTKQEPEYPAAARQFRLSGEVVAEFTVGVDGKVESVAVTKGSPIFSDSVIKALRRWSFSPIKVDGRVRRVKSTLKFQFQL
jgi:TonB family protein